jgi:hypothetical protein
MLAAAIPIEKHSLLSKQGDSTVRTTTRVCCFLMVFIGCVGVVKAAGKAVKIEKTWDGEIALELRKQAPADGYIANEEDFAKLWKAYRGDAELPKVDFTKQIILVAVNSDPNQLGITATLDNDGDLKIAVMSTLRAYIDPKTCRYQFALISRDGVKTIKGQPLKDK